MKDDDEPTDQTFESALIARHGWAALLDLLVAKKVITQDEATGVKAKAYEAAQAAGLRRTATFPPHGRDHG